LILVCEDGRYTGVIELDVGVVNTHKVDRGVCGDERDECV
jgi:hypothetical protein